MVNAEYAFHWTAVIIIMIYLSDQDGRDLPTTCTILDADSDSGSYAATIFPTSNAQYFETIFRKVRNGFQLRKNTLFELYLNRLIV